MPPPPSQHSLETKPREQRNERNQVRGGDPTVVQPRKRGQQSISQQVEGNQNVGLSATGSKVEMEPGQMQNIHRGTIPNKQPARGQAKSHAEKAVCKVAPQLMEAAAGPSWLLQWLISPNPTLAPNRVHKRPVIQLPNNLTPALSPGSLLPQIWMHGLSLLVPSKPIWGTASCAGRTSMMSMRAMSTHCQTHQNPMPPSASDKLMGHQPQRSQRHPPSWSK